MKHMRASGHRRPLLWAYNPALLGPYAAVPAVARVYHASENYFAYRELAPSFLRALEAMIHASDLTVAVSNGVARAIEDRLPGSCVERVPNGCDYAFYAGAEPDDELRVMGAAFERIAVFAGNINARIDFDLLQRAVQTFDGTLFALFGPARDMNCDERERWEVITACRNVVWFGAVAPERLPGVYAAADVGLIPYKADPLIVDSGFPLKALEMSAACLPSVTTKMVALEGLATGLVVTEDEHAFLAALSTTGRSCLSVSQAAELRDVARANDYDAKFSRIAALAAAFGREGEPVTRIDIVTSEMGAEWMNTLLAAADEPRKAELLGLKLSMKQSLIEVVGRFPRRVRAVLPARLRHRVVRFLNSSPSE